MLFTRQKKVRAAKVLIYLAMMTVAFGGVFWQRQHAASRSIANNEQFAKSACIQYLEAQEVFCRGDNGYEDYASNLAALKKYDLIPSQIAAADSTGSAVVPFHGYIFKIIRPPTPVVTPRPNT